MAIIHGKRCNTCESKKPGNSWKEIGEQVEIKGDRIAGDTRYRFLQCAACGSVWIATRDVGGAGGSEGPFYNRLTDRYF